MADLFPKYSKMVWSDVDVIFCNEFSADFLNIKEDDENYFYGVLEVEKNHMMEGFLFLIFMLFLMKNNLKSCLVFKCCYFKCCNFKR
ncbi:hypothetical protein BIZ47_06955 [Helicobacter pylori]|nr:hypothetical protein BIZ47_06955 [Helicobacter pylori]